MANQSGGRKSNDEKWTAIFSEHDPEKPTPDLIRGVETGFPKRSCAANDGERRSM
jgi:hypothetical protein